MLVIYLFLFSMIVSFAVTPYLLSMAKKIEKVDFSRSREQNNDKIPRIGGFLLFASILISFIFYGDYANNYKLLSAFLIISFVGIYDDIKDMRWYFKLGLQFISSFFIISQLGGDTLTVSFIGLEVSGILSVILLSCFIVGAMNSINLLDGIDGLVGGFTLIICGILIPLAYVGHNNFVIYLAVATVGGIIAFLKYNSPPASIHLGDSGSLIVGFILIVSSLLVAKAPETNTFDLSFVFIMLSIPIIDMVRVSLNRLRKGISPFEADLTHLHHKFLAQISVANTSFFVLIITIFNAIFALLYFRSHNYIFFILAIASTLFLTLEGHYKLIVIPSARFVVSSFLKINKWEHLGHNVKLAFLAILTFVALFTLVANIPQNSYLVQADLINLLVALVIIFSVSLYYSIVSKLYYHVLFFLNINIYLVLSQENFSQTNFGLHNMYHAAGLLDISGPLIVILSFSIISFLNLVLTKNQKGFASIFDINILYVVILSILFDEVQIFSFLGPFNTIIRISFMLYLWYRLLDTIFPKLTKYLYFLSFAIPVIALLKLIIV